MATPRPPLSLLAVAATATGALALPLVPAVLGFAALPEIRSGARRGAGLARMGVALGVFWFVAEGLAAGLFLARPDLVLAPLFREAMAHNEASASRAMRKIVAQEEITKRDYPDEVEFGIHSYWWKDLAGMLRLSMEHKGRPEELDVDIANADATNEQGNPVVPRDGYVFRIVAGTDHLTQFAATAHPDRYGMDGMKTFYVDERGVVWWKDLHGAPADRRVEEPSAEGWSRVE